MITVVTGYSQMDVMNYIDHDKRFDSTYCLKFPEEGKHPKFSCRIVDTFLNKNNDIVITTLSESIVTRIGYLIAKGKIKGANLVWIDEDYTPHECVYNDKGYIDGWKIGFFSPERIK